MNEPSELVHRLEPSQPAHHAKSLAALNAVAATVSQSLDLETTLNVALEQALQVIGVEAGGISLVDEDAGELALRVSRGWRQTDLANTMRLPLGVGMSGQVIASGQVLVTGDVRDDPRLAVPAFGHEGVQAMALAPMRAHGKVVGVLSAMSYQPHTFSPDDVTLLAAIADQVGVAIDNARLYQDTRRRVDELTALHEISVAAMYAAYDLAQAAKRMVNALQRSLSFEYVSLLLVNEADRVIELYATAGLADEQSPIIRIPLGQGLVGSVVNSGRPLRVGKVELEPRYLPGIPGVHSELAVPLKVGEQVIGVIDVQSLLPNAFTADDERVLMTAAGQLAITIENVRLYAETRRQLDELSTLHLVSLAAISTLDLPQAIKRIVDTLQRSLRFEYVGLFLVDEMDRTAKLYATSTQAGERGRNVLIPYEQGIVGNAVASGQPLRVGNVQQEPRHLPGISGVCSEMAVPLKVGGRVVGAIDVQSPRQNAFTADDERMLVTVAGHLASIIQNARLYAETRRQLDELTILSEVALAGASTLDLEQVLDRMLQVIRRTLQFESFEFILLDPATRILHTQVGYGTLMRARDYDVRVGQGVVGWVAEQGQPLLVQDVKQEPRYFEADLHTQSELAVPLKVGDQVIGVMNVESPYLNRFTEDDQRLLTVLAGQMSVIIQDARLHAETQRRLVHVTALYTFAQQLSTSLDINAVLDSIVISLKQILNCRAANIWLINHETQLLEIRAAAGLQSKWKREARLKIGVGIAGKVAATAQSIYVPDTHQMDFLFFDHAVRSLLCVPLMVHERVVGVLAVDSDRPQAFTSDDELLLTIVAAQASVAIENAQLFEAATERASELEQAYRDLQEADRLKDELVQNMSHELKTPLTFVKGYIELLLEGELGVLSEEQRNSLGIVLEKTDTITRLVEDILLLQQIERGSLQMTRFDLAELAQRSVDDFELSSDHSVAVTLDGQAAQPVVTADADRISQVFNNLIGNAVKFSPNGGAIVIQFQDKGSMIQTVVRDTGIGIPENLLARVFERFYQVDGSSTRQYGGTGLGLAIVKRIIEAHSGQVWVESQLGQGSSFYFTLPKVDLSAKDWKSNNLPTVTPKYGQNEL